MMARIDSEKPRPLDISYAIHSADPLWDEERQMVFLSILALARMMVWSSRVQEKRRVESFADLVLSSSTS